MIDLYYWTTPNGHKITMFLEETGLKYKIFPVNIGKGDQFKPEFLAVAPNNRIPAMVDHEVKGGGKPISIFESGAMLLYLAATMQFNGRSGRWAGWGRWPARTITSRTTPRRR
jgi:GST-like protein